MNFLAHIYLSYGHEKLMVGNFIGDFVKGNQLNNYEEEIQKGVILHRLIDEFTDSHEIVHQSKNRLRKKYRHYSGVIVDVYYDHFLAKDWQKYHPLPLERYSLNFYNRINKYKDRMPERAQFMLPYMIKDNWLLNYAKIDGIRRALSGMSRRTKFDSKMDESVADLSDSYDEFQTEFSLFFTDLSSFSRHWIDSELG